MATFKDESNREWIVSLDGPTIKAVRNDCKIDPIAGEAYEKLSLDYVLLGEVLAVICRDQIVSKAGGVTIEQFTASVRGDAIDRGLKAFHEAQVDFSPSREKEVLRALAAKMEKLREVAAKADLDRLKSPEVEARILEALNMRQEAALETALMQLTHATNSPGLSTSAQKD